MRTSEQGIEIDEMYETTGWETCSMRKVRSPMVRDIKLNLVVR